MSSILILGASSPTAQAFIKMMSDEYPDVHLRLFVRNINKLPMEQRHKLDIIIGNGANYDDYVRALSGIDYVYNAIGGAYSDEYTSILLRAIRDSKCLIKHIVDISVSSEQSLSGVRRIHPEYTQNQIIKLKMYQGSGLDFTILQSGSIKNGPETPVVTLTSDYKKDDTRNLNISRATLARAAINALFKNQYACESLFVTNEKSA